MIKLINNLKNLKANKLNAGMTYVELIVVLSIFAVMSSIVVYNYGDFQARVDIKNLASDIALKIVEAQKSSVNGVLPLNPPADWKPSYGVYFDITKPKQFVYFKDLSNPINGYDPGVTETLDTIVITKNSSISKIENCTSVSSCVNIVNPISVSFQRPDSSAIFTGASVTGYIQITVQSPKTAFATIKVYPSGRIQVN